METIRKLLHHEGPIHVTIRNLLVLVGAAAVIGFLFGVVTVG